LFRYQWQKNTIQYATTPEFSLDYSSTDRNQTTLSAGTGLYSKADADLPGKQTNGKQVDKKTDSL
jgi:hypothetical protein